MPGRDRGVHSRGHASSSRGITGPVTEACTLLPRPGSRHLVLPSHRGAKSRRFTVIVATAEDRIKMECDKCGYKCIPQWSRSSVANVSREHNHHCSTCEWSCNVIKARLHGYSMSAYVARLLDWHAEAKRQSPLLEMPGQLPACCVPERYEPLPSMGVFSQLSAKVCISCHNMPPTETFDSHV